MKTIYMPNGKRLECKCGCVFEYSPSDIQRNPIHKPDETWYIRKYVVCPYCGIETTVEKINDCSSNVIKKDFGRLLLEIMK